VHVSKRVPLALAVLVTSVVATDVVILVLYVLIPVVQKTHDLFSVLREPCNALLILAEHQNAMHILTLHVIQITAEVATLSGR
jgi:hypothetical protein